MTNDERNPKLQVEGRGADGGAGLFWQAGLAGVAAGGTPAPRGKHADLLGNTGCLRTATRLIKVGGEKAHKAQNGRVKVHQGSSRFVGREIVTARRSLTLL